MFITFEGIEGSGKSTQLRRLAEHLRAAGHSVVETREPGGTPAGAAIRSLLLGDPAVALSPLAELLLYCADRAQHVAERVRPALASGAIVLCDRFSDSTIAYQGFGRGLDVAMVTDLDARARWSVADAHLSPRLPGRRAPPAAAARAGKGDRFEQAPAEFHENIRRGFRQLAAAEPDRFVVLDALGPIEQTTARVVTETLRRLEARG
ncbi:MAG: dTMP kinase [Candidatus Binatia bacterium]